MIKILIFDFDGTISNSFNLGINSLKIVLKANNLVHDNRLKEFLGCRISEVLKRMNISSKFLSTVQKQFYNLIIKNVNELNPCVDLAPLKILSESYRMVIVSNSETDYLNKAIKHFRIQNIFREFYGSDKFKNKEFMIKKILHKHRIKPLECLCIGDRPSDINSARIAGCWTAGINNRHSWSTLKQIKESNPDFMIKSFHNLKEILNRLNKK